jgi:hypothetical protein
MEISDGTIINCNHEWCLKMINKFNLQSQTPSTVAHERDSIVGNVETSYMCSLICEGLYREAACSRNKNCSWGVW